MKLLRIRFLRLSVTGVLWAWMAFVNPVTAVVVEPGAAAQPDAESAKHSGTCPAHQSAIRFCGPKGLTLDSSGNLYVADTLNQTIRKIPASGAAVTLAGMSGGVGSADGSGSDARFDCPGAVAVDKAGNVYVADTCNHTVRLVTQAGEVRTIAGSARHAGSADGEGDQARFGYPRGIAVDNAGIVYVADFFNHTIRMLRPSATNWTVSTLAGLAKTKGDADGSALSARFNYPRSIAVDNAGNIFVADSGNLRIRKLFKAGSGWVVSTLAADPGNLRISCSGTADVDTLVNTLAGADLGEMDNYPGGVAVDPRGNLFAVFPNKNLIGKITAQGDITVVAGGHSAKGNSDGDSKTARFSSPYGIAVDDRGNVYVADTGNQAIRKIDREGVTSTIGGALDNPWR